ncbi:hypothetical protein [Tsukamurella pseudospumae]|uniref:Uncharacterized protein n=1 Tax=Tsukamurella pseudospumae TaxID=239498 RepID=A0A138A8G4_9ACTN|nr:hypothetical protein [Tsukamurella pseudospumae]KXP06722.1 hypothetical protein AXK60_11705 [Tsukamurella pseudospumae]
MISFNLTDDSDGIAARVGSTTVTLDRATADRLIVDLLMPRDGQQMYADGIPYGHLSRADALVAAQRLRALLDHLEEAEPRDPEPELLVAVTWANERTPQDIWWGVSHDRMEHLDLESALAVRQYLAPAVQAAGFHSVHIFGDDMAMVYPSSLAALDHAIALVLPTTPIDPAALPKEH